MMTLYKGCSNTLTIQTSPPSPNATVTAEFRGATGTLLLSATLTHIGGGAFRMSVPSTLPIEGGQMIRLRAWGADGDERAYLNAPVRVREDS